MSTIRKRVYLPGDENISEIRYNPKEELIKLAQDMKNFQLIRKIKRLNPMAEILVKNYKKQKSKSFYLVRGIDWPFDEGEIPENCVEIAMVFRMNNSVPNLPEEFFEGLRIQGHEVLEKYLKKWDTLELISFEDFAMLV